MTLPRLFALALLLVTAGCTTPDAGEGDAGDEEAEGQVVSEGRPFLFNVAGPAAGPGVAGNDVAPFTVAANATTLFLEAEWTCASPTCTLDLVLLDEAGEEVGRMSGQGSATLLVEDPPAGEYQYGMVTSTELVAQAGGRMAASAFYGMEMPGNYTGLTEE